MTLILKFNLVFIAVFLIGLGAAAYMSDRLLQHNAREEILQNARLLMEGALATRAYTSNQVGPLLQTQMKYVFLPQSVPAYSATEVFNGLRKRFPEYGYKEATLNPTNPRDRAVEWEADVVNAFRNRADLTELSGERSTPTGRALYVARPIQISRDGLVAPHQRDDITALHVDGHQRPLRPQIEPQPRRSIGLERFDQPHAQHGADRSELAGRQVLGVIALLVG